jgi:hypothetical protein
VWLVRSASFAAAACLVAVLFARTARAEQKAPPAPAQEDKARHLAVDVGGVAAAREIGIASVDSNGNTTPFALGMGEFGGGVTLGVGFVSQRPRVVSLMFRAQYLAGRTDLTLPSQFVSLGAEVLYAPWVPLGFFFGVHGDWLGLGRVTTTPFPSSDGTNQDPPAIQHWGIGASIGAEATILNEDMVSLFVRPELAGTLMPHMLFEPRSGIIGGTLTLGGRFHIR